MKKIAILTIIEGTIKTGFLITFSIQEEKGNLFPTVRANLPPKAKSNANLRNGYTLSS